MLPNSKSITKWQGVSIKNMCICSSTGRIQKLFDACKMYFRNENYKIIHRRQQNRKYYLTAPQLKAKQESIRLLGGHLMDLSWCYLII